MTGLRIRGAHTLLLGLSVAACQGSGAVQPTPSPSRVASPRSTEQVAELVAGAIVPWFAARSAPR